MAKRNLTLQQHLEHPNYGFRFGLVLKHLEEQYGWDTEEITSEEDVILIITLSLEQNIPPVKIAEQLDAQLKAKEEEEIEPISAPTKSVGMFESDLWEHEIPRAPMHGPWTLPSAKGGFLHTPRIESPRSSPHYVPGYQKVRIYAQDLIDRGISKTRAEIAHDLGMKKVVVTSALRGSIGLKYSTLPPNLPKIEVAERPMDTKAKSTKALIYGLGIQDEKDENRQKLVEEITNVFLERIAQDDERDQFKIAMELAKEYKIGRETIISLLGDVYDQDLSLDIRMRKRSRAVIGKAGTTEEEIEEYLREFGEEFSTNYIANVLGVSKTLVTRLRIKLGIKDPEFSIAGRKIRGRKIRVDD